MIDCGGVSLTSRLPRRMRWSLLDYHVPRVHLELHSFTSIGGNKDYILLVHMWWAGVVIVLVVLVLWPYAFSVCCFSLLVLKFQNGIFL